MYGWGKVNKGISLINAPAVTLIFRHTIGKLKLSTCAYACSRSDHTLTYRSMAQRSSEELLADWSSELEAVLYDPEVEEAIREVSE